MKNKVMVAIAMSALMFVAYADTDLDSVTSSVEAEAHEREAYAKELFAPVSFNLGSYFYIQEDLKQYISDFSVVGNQWGELKALHDSGDYLGMLGVLSGRKLREYPDKEGIKRLYSKMLGGMFSQNYRVSLAATHNINLVCRAFPGMDCHLPGITALTDFRNMQMMFAIRGGKCFYVYTPDDKINLIIKKYAEARDKVREDMKLARIFEEDGAKQIEALNQEQFHATLKWLSSAKVRPGPYIRLRQPMSKSFWREFNAAGKKTAVPEGKILNEKAEPSGDRAVRKAAYVCPECNGRKYLSTKSCEKCDGAGYSLREAWITDLSGNRLPAKKQKCAACQGKGTVYTGRRKCPRCAGTGVVE